MNKIFGIDGFYYKENGKIQDIGRKKAETIVYLSNDGRSLLENMCCNINN